MAGQFDEEPPLEVLLQGVLDVVFASMYQMEGDDRETFIVGTLESLQTLYDRGEHLRYWDA